MTSPSFCAICSLRCLEDFVASQDITSDERMCRVCARKLHEPGVFLMFKLVAYG